MRVELIIKSARIKETSEEEKKDKKLQRLLGKEDDDTEEMMLSGMMKVPVEFSYRPYVIDSHDIANFGPYDDNHVLCIVDGYGEMLVKFQYDKWLPFYEEITGLKIKRIKEYTQEMPKIPPRRSKGLE